VRGDVVFWRETSGQTLTESTGGRPAAAAFPAPAYPGPFPPYSFRHTHRVTESSSPFVLALYFAFLPTALEESAATLEG
jgi:hypothetical protein